MAGVRSWVVAVCFILVPNVAFGHIPYYNSAEPDAPTFVSDIPADKMSRETAADRLTAMRGVMNDVRVDAYIVPTADAHNSQYIAPADARREWLSGLRGSSGTALVTATKALVWTDARYWTQFEVEVDGDQWTLMKQVLVSLNYNEHVPKSQDRHEWLSGLRGSSGTALLTADKALVWTDARYWTNSK
ncbi:hypothetical protein PYW07_012701 [Mythimna separata]|uniref:Creatinase N-terminal domain-containing protein n=1 Tax=Mythimna separata TaxID=271217 RepID=A0AAD7Y8H6_MYTSE|nr:hypothetical protein PYW07_012701 [Mythimna separata]